MTLEHYNAINGYFDLESINTKYVAIEDRMERGIYWTVHADSFKEFMAETKHWPAPYKPYNREWEPTVYGYALMTVEVIADDIHKSEFNPNSLHWIYMFNNTLNTWDYKARFEDAHWCLYQSYINL